MKKKSLLVITLLSGLLLLPCLFSPLLWRGAGPACRTGRGEAAAQTPGEWTWMHGDSVPDQPGSYGTQGVPSPANYPGSRGWGAATWTDTSGNLWLFGGSNNGNSGASFNDLWKYDPDPASPTYNQWTWMKGPKTMGNLGSYGTQGVSIAANLPPSRFETSCSWTDNSGNLWLYGGAGGAGFFGNLWKYTISTNEWVWVQGAKTSDLSGNLWLFGGESNAMNGFLNDLWKYDITINQWTWMKGPNTYDDPGNYGTKCVSANTNLPPARYENRARVRDGCGNFWNFGGFRMVGATSWGNLNDLWYYNVSTNQWTWVSGDTIINRAAVYGTQGISGPANKPGAKNGSVAWIDNNGYIWVFGGENGAGNCNDLFRYVPDTACVPMPAAVITASFNTTICNGQSATLIASGGTSYLWSPGGQSATSIVVSPAASTTYTVTGNNLCGSGSSSVTVTVNTPPAASAWNNVTITAGSSTTLSSNSNPSSVAYNWSPTAGLNCTTCQNPVAAPSVTTVYCVTVTDANNCTDDSCITVTIEQIDCPSSDGLYLPNAFSPNNDGENDVLQIYYGNAFCIKTLHLVIYDR